MARNGNTEQQVVSGSEEPLQGRIPGVVPASVGDLARIVTERLEENTRLEFKRQVPESGKNDHLAKDVAAMANSDGGVIVYGIEEDEAGRAKALAPINLKGAAERVILIAQTFDEPLTVKNAKASRAGEMANRASWSSKSLAATVPRILSTALRSVVARRATSRSPEDRSGSYSRGRLVSPKNLAWCLCARDGH